MFRREEEASESSGSEVGVDWLSTLAGPNCYHLLPIRAYVTIKRQHHNRTGQVVCACLLSRSK